jgi:hypothetical protein
MPKDKPVNPLVLLIGAVLGWGIVNLVAAIFVVAYRIVTMAVSGLADFFLT